MDISPKYEAIPGAREAIPRADATPSSSWYRPSLRLLASVGIVTLIVLGVSFSTHAAPNWSHYAHHRAAAIYRRAAVMGRSSYLGRFRSEASRKAISANARTARYDCFCPKIYDPVCCGTNLGMQTSPNECECVCQNNGVVLAPGECPSQSAVCSQGCDSAPLEPVCCNDHGQLFTDPNECVCVCNYGGTVKHMGAC